MSKKNTIFLILALIVFVLTAMVGTYARYKSEGAGNATATIAKWAVQVNGDSIAADPENTFNATIAWTPNANVADNYVAPGMSGTANIEIDPTDSQVAMNYWMNIDTTSLSNPNFEVTDVKVNAVSLSKVALGTCSGGTGGTTSTECSANGGTWTNSTDPHAGEYTGSIALPAGGKMTTDQKVTAVVTITWVDKNDDTSNAADTTTGIAAGIKTIPVTVTVEQKVN